MAFSSSWWTGSSGFVSHSIVSFSGEGSSEMVLPLSLKADPFRLVYLAMIASNLVTEFSLVWGERCISKIKFYFGYLPVAIRGFGVLGFWGDRKSVV